MTITHHNAYNEEKIIESIDECFEQKPKLTSWERGFLSTCYRMTDRRIMLSQRQRDILTEIHRRVACDD